MLSIGDDYWIENSEGQRVFKVDGKVLRIRKTLVLEDIHGKPLCQIKERLLTIKDTMVIEDPNGKDIAVMKKALISPLRDRWDVKVNVGDDLVVQGNFIDHEYTIKRKGKKVAEVSKKWFRITDTYGVDVDEGQNDVLIIAVAVVIDTMAHEKE